MAQDVVINNERFSAKDVKISFLGITSRGVTELNHKESETVTNVKVVGSKKSAGYVTGDEEYEGDMTLLSEETIAMEIAAGGSVRNLKPFPITKTIWKNGLLIKLTLVGVKITGVEKGVSGGNAEALKDKITFKYFDEKRNY